jgi:DNA-directed RNA polymerase specialized sigma24 family protein
MLFIADEVLSTDYRVVGEPKSHGRVAAVGDRVAGAEAARQLLRADQALRKKIFVQAYRLTGNLPDAHDLAHEGMAAAIDPEASPWDPDKQPNLRLHVGSFMNGVMVNRRRAEARYRSTPFDPKDHDRVDPAPNPEQRLLNAEELAEFERRLERLRERLADDAIALGMLELFGEGVSAAAELAARLAHLGCEVKDVYRARERIAYHAKQVAGLPPVLVARAQPLTEVDS